MNDSSIVASFKKQLLNAISADLSDKAMQLIRKHDKNLEKGDFSFPNLSNDKVWAKHNICKLDTKDIVENIPSIEKIEINCDSCVIFLRRKNVFEEFYKNSRENLFSQKSKTISIVNFDSIKPNSSSLTSARVSCFYEVLRNLNLTQNWIIGISSTDVNSQLDNHHSEFKKVGIRVGAVLGKENRKEELLDFSTYKSKIYEEVQELDEERCDEYENLKDKESRLKTLENASIQFNFLWCNISNPVKIILDSLSNSNASFVLYNSARIKKLLHTFDEYVTKGDYPPLPTTENISVDVLTELGEWELLFNFLIPYHDLIEECISTLRIHKLVQFLVNLASTYSRYYNKVKLLKEPLPHLVPILHARIWLIKEVNKVFDEALSILNIKSLKNM